MQRGNVARPEVVRDKFHFGFYSTKNFSPWLDLVIAVMTVRTILTGFGPCQGRGRLPPAGPARDRPVRPSLPLSSPGSTFFKS